jgi:hypothetical protein
MDEMLQDLSAFAAVHQDPVSMIGGYWSRYNCKADQLGFRRPCTGCRFVAACCATKEVVHEMAGDSTWFVLQLREELRNSGLLWLVGGGEHRAEFLCYR